jgi:AcrR family transcriptional regulator
VLDAAFEVLVDSGYEATTMLAVAQRAGASKETLYAWFGRKEGLLAAMIRREAEQAGSAVERALGGRADPRRTLEGFAAGLLTLLLGRRSLAINRAAMTSPELARVLLAHGRHTTGPIVERYLSQLAADGVIGGGRSAALFELLYGLIVRDSQIRALLGEDPLTPRQIRLRAREAVDSFFALTQPPRAP